jgi:hypothetical protein
MGMDMGRMMRWGMGLSMGLLVVVVVGMPVGAAARG